VLCRGGRGKDRGTATSRGRDGGKGKGIDHPRTRAVGSRKEAQSAGVKKDPYSHRGWGQREGGGGKQIIKIGKGRKGRVEKPALPHQGGEETRRDERPCLKKAKRGKKKKQKLKSGKIGE